MKTDNETIAEFIGWTKSSFGGGWEHPEKELPIWTSEMKYDTSWDWLMPVVEKIEVTLDLEAREVVEISQHRCTITGSDKRNLIDRYGITKIEATYRAVVNFIKWYNSVDKTKTK